MLRYFSICIDTKRGMQKFALLPTEAGLVRQLSLLHYVRRWYSENDTCFLTAKSSFHNLGSVQTIGVDFGEDSHWVALQSSSANLYPFECTLTEVFIQALTEGWICDQQPLVEPSWLGFVISKVFFKHRAIRMPHVYGMVCLRCGPSYRLSRDVRQKVHCDFERWTINRILGGTPYTIKQSSVTLYSPSVMSAHDALPRSLRAAIESGFDMNIFLTDQQYEQGLSFLLARIDSPASVLTAGNSFLQLLGVWRGFSSGIKPHDIIRSCKIGASP